MFHPLPEPMLWKRNSSLRRESMAGKPTIKAPSQYGDIIFSALVKLAALITLFLLGGIIVSLIIASWPSIEKFGWAFLWTKEWDAPAEQFGALVPIYGTVVTSVIALLIAVPVSFGIALFLTELAPNWLKRPVFQDRKSVV